MYMALVGSMGTQKQKGPARCCHCPMACSEEEMHLCSPQRPLQSTGGIAPVECMAGDCLQTEGPGCAGDVPWRRRALSAGSKLIQM